MNARTCSVTDCPRPSRTRGLCAAHYQRWLDHGDTRPDIPIRHSRRPLQYPEIVDRFEDLIESGRTTQEAVDMMPVHPRTICRAYQSESLPVPPGLWTAQKKAQA